MKTKSNFFTDIEYDILIDELSGKKTNKVGFTGVFSQRILPKLIEFDKWFSMRRKINKLIKNSYSQPPI